MTKIYTLIITTDENHTDIIIKMIKSVANDKIKIEIGPE